MTGAPAAPETSGPRQREVLIELVTLHARVLRRMPLVQLLLVSGLALVFVDKVTPQVFAAWAVPALGIETLRAIVAAWVLRRLESIDPVRVHRWFVAMAACAGAADGLAGVLFLPRINVIDQAWLGVVLFAIPAAGVAVSMSSRYILGAFALAIIVPASITWGLLHPEHRSVIPLGLLYSGLLILVAAESERLLMRAVLIRQERDRVVRDLERSNAEVRAARIRAEDAAQARARVLAAASHDLRQPLHALSIYSAILAANPSPATLREVGENIDQIVRSLGHLLGGLLDLSRLSTGYLNPEQRVFALDAECARICAEFDSLARAKGLILRTSLPGTPVCGDQMIVGRIARNLIDNAIKYTDAGEISLTLSRADGHTLLSVADTGKGIAQEEQQRVFEEFYQIDNPGRDRSKGVGLGLALVQRMAELIGATISLRSQPGRGSCFTLALPDALPDGGQASLPTSAPLAPIPAGTRIYVVDDEQDILVSTRTLLTLWGARVETANCVPDTMALFERLGPPALLIADLQLGGPEHGTTMARRLRAAWGEFPVLITTGETSSEALRETSEAGYPLLHKPITAERLREMISGAVAPLGHDADA